MLSKVSRVRFAVLSVLGMGLLSGCIAQRVISPKPALVRASVTHIPVKRRGLRPPSRHPAPIPVFARVVSRLQILGYLPLVPAQIHGRQGRMIRHDAFRFPVPSALQHAADQYAWTASNPFIRAAIVQFERQNGILHPRGVSLGRLHPSVLRAILSAQAKPDATPWEWVLVDKASGTRIPESLHLWRWSEARHVGRWIWKTVVNTGVLGSTPNGTWFVYQRLPRTTMRGVFPIPISWSAWHALAGQQVPQWGGSRLLQPARGLVHGHPVRWQPYDDPGILWVNYFDDGRGIHYYPRAAYGFPQSAGCVEEPYRSAPVTYRLLNYGVPVTISAGIFPSFPIHQT